MRTVLITTDFSAASQHALDYACLTLRGRDVLLDLLHIFTVPVSYTTDGVALAAIGQAIDRAEDRLEEEAKRAGDAYPGIKIEGRVVTGSYLQTLRQETRLTQPLFMILGTAGFADLYLGDADPLNALRILRVPVLFVPYGAELKAVRNIAYASNYAFVGPQTPVQEIADWTRLMGTSLQVVHTDPQPQGADPKQTSGEAWLKERLAPLNPTFHWVEDGDVLRGLGRFIAGSEVDCVLVVPRRYGIWQNLFRQSRTKALARLNKVPIIAFHAKD